MATESNFPPSQGTAVDVKIPIRVELHKVKFLWVARPPILGQTIDRYIRSEKNWVVSLRFITVLVELYR